MMTLDFAYTLYLILLNDKSVPNAQIKRYVQRWFVMSTLTSRYIGSPETVMDRDMRSIGEKGFLNFMNEVEASNLSDTFWSITLPQLLESSSVNSPAFNTFLAAQINLNCNSVIPENLPLLKAYLGIENAPAEAGAQPDLHHRIFKQVFDIATKNTG